MLSLVIGSLAATCCTISFIPQVIKIYKTKNTSDLSLVTFVVFAVGVALWFIYGLMIGSVPMIAANALTLVFALFIVAMKLKCG